MDPTFRRGGLEDVSTLLPMMREFYRHEAIPFEEERSRRLVERLLVEPGAGDLWLVELNALPVGYMVMTQGFSLELGGWYGFIDELFVGKAHRSAGLGSAAIHHIQGECARRGLVALLLEADLLNERATRLYRRLGFREHRRRLMSCEVEARLGD